MMGTSGNGILRKAAAVAATLVTATLPTAPAWAVGGSFHCSRSSAIEVGEQVSGSFALQNIVTEYMRRWDAANAMEQCQAYAEGRPYEIICMNGRRDWPAIIESVPEDYFGRSNQSLAETARAEKRQGNGYKAALDYCRSVGAIR